MKRALGTIGLAFLLAFPGAFLMAAIGYAAYFLAAFVLPEGGPEVMFATLWVIAFGVSLLILLWHRAKPSSPKTGA